ncbi:MAG: hypothetical protein H7Y11_15010 [Armatimonadetes bacterium]|nr:hypothetical protein [Anaerolineae bacterium]
MHWFLAHGVATEQVQGVGWGGWVVLLALLLMIPLVTKSKRRRGQLRLAVGILALVLVGATIAYERLHPHSDTLVATDAEPFNDSTITGDLLIETVIDPGVPGDNQVYVTLFDRNTGARLDDAQSVTARLTHTESGEWVALLLTSVGDGGYSAAYVPLTAAGAWQAVISVRRGNTTDVVTLAVALGE